MIWSIYSSSNDGSLMEHQMIRSWWDRDNIITIALTAKNDFFRFYRKSNEEMNNINYEAISRWCCDIEHILIFSAALLSSSPISFFSLIYSILSISCLLFIFSTLHTPFLPRHHVHLIPQLCYLWSICHRVWSTHSNARKTVLMLCSLYATFRWCPLHNNIAINIDSISFSFSSIFFSSFDGECTELTRATVCLRSLYCRSVHIYRLHE